MAHDRRFRFAAQLSKAPDATARSWAEQARRAEDLGYTALLMPDHFGDQLAPMPALGRRGGGDQHAAHGGARVLQRLPPSLRAGQGGGHARRAERGPLRAEPRGRLDAHRLRRGGTHLRPPGRAGGALRGGGEGRPGPAAHGRPLQFPRRALRGPGAHPHAPAGAAAGAAAHHRRRGQAGAVLRRAPGRHRQHQRQPARGDGRGRDGGRRHARAHPRRRWPGSRRRRATASTTWS